MPYSVHMDGIDEKLRPPLTPWGQARFDASAPLVGPRAVAGKENNPALHCEPEAVPKSLILPNPFEIVQIPGRMFMFFEQYHLWRTVWSDGRPLPKDPDPSFLGILGRKVGGRHVCGRHDRDERQALGRFLWKSAERADAPDGALPAVGS